MSAIWRLRKTYECMFKNNCTALSQSELSNFFIYNEFFKDHRMIDIHESVGRVLFDVLDKLTGAFHENHAPCNNNGSAQYIIYTCTVVGEICTGVSD
jgi:hypothetical protein